MKKFLVYCLFGAVVAVIPAAAQDVMTIINDRVGIGEEGPDADFHLANVDGIGDTVFKFDTGSDSWNFGLTVANGVLTFNKSGTGGQEFTIRARNDTQGATLDVQGSVKATNVAFPSSRALKTGFEAMDTSLVLDRVASLPMTSWRFKTDPEDMVRFGPMAEDFHSLFDVGDGKTITVLDLQGVSLAAIQGLHQELQAKDAAIESLRVELDELRALIEAQ